MPSVDVAMARSLRPSAWEAIRDVVVRSIAADLQRRDLISDAQNKVSDVQTAFSSWDNCMQAAYCKWPVIAIIIVGSLILLSILACIVRCACCAKSCCCSCFSCLKCCGNCCGCCDPPNRKHKYLDEPYIPPHHGYQQQAPMQAFPNAAPPQRHAAVASPPQYAEFEMAKKGPEDSLPQMPSWETAGAKKVMLENEEGVEMDQLKSPNKQDPRLGRVGSPASGPVSPMSVDGRNPYGPQGGYMGAAAAGGAAGAAYAHGRQPGGPYSPREQQFRNQSPAPGPGGYGQGRNPSNPGYNQGYNQHGYNQGREQMLSPPNDYSSNRISDGYGLDQPYDQPQPQSSGNPLAATAAAAGLTGAAAGAALAAGAVGRGSPSPGPHGYGQQSQAGHNQGYAEMPAEPNPYGNAVDNQNQNQAAGQNQYAEMPADGRASDQNVHAVFAEMPADGHASPSPAAKEQENTHYFEMATDQVAPVELDSGYVAPIQTSQSPANDQASARSPTTAQSPQDYPQGYGMQRRGTGDAPNDPYARQRQGSADRNSPAGYGMQRRGTGDNSGAGSPSPYGMDPRMRNSPAPMSPGPRSPAAMSPGPRSPGPRNSPGPRRPVPRGDQPFAPSPLSTPIPQNESAYNRPGYNNNNNRTYSPAPRAQRSPDHNVPVARPTQQTAFAEPQPKSPITNNAGFDFTSGFSRPQDAFDRRPSESQEPASREGYPGYKPYNQPQGGWNGV